MSSILNDTLFVSRLESGGLQLDLAPTALRPIFQRVVQNYRGVVKEKRVQVGTRAPASRPVGRV